MKKPEAYKRGTLTVFYGMTVMLILSVFFSLLEVVHVVGVKNQQNLASEIAIESLFADYNRLLWNDYRILAVDLGYGSASIDIDRAIERMSEYAQDNISPASARSNSKDAHFFRSTLSMCELDAYGLLTDSGGNALIKEAAANVVYGLGENSIDKLLKSNATIKKNLEESVSCEDLMQSGSDAGKEAARAAAEAAAASGAQNSGEGTTVSVQPPDNPTDTIMAWKKSGVLGQVLPVDIVLSEHVFSEQRVSRRVLRSGSIGGAKRVSARDKTLFGMYLKKNIQSFTHPLSHAGASYEWEHVVCGKDSDIENMESVVKKLLALREVENLISLMGDAGKVSQASALAVSIAGASANPVLVKAVELGLIAAWAYVESVLDVRTLLAGKKVALVKSPAEWTSQLPALASYTDVSIKAKDSPTGMSYEDYLLSLTFLESSKDLAYRTAEVYEDALCTESDYVNVRADQLLYAADVRFSYDATPLFLSLVPTRDVISSYTTQRDIHMSYID